ncbi:MAG: SRPBCC family protein [Bacteroidetes bacterium]|nr:SRPBCC family protein [Bacteroidota bacterium]MCK6611087.1 SRPBCC family protein [Bacteroidia bacterium]
MKLFKVFLGIFVVVGLFFGISLFFPSQYRIEKFTVVNIPVWQTYAYLNDMRNWQEWSPWNSDLDSTLKISYTPVSTGTGARQFIEGELYGKGFMEIALSIPNERIHYRLQMNDSNINSSATFVFEPIGNKTKLIWLDSGDVGNNPIYRYLLPSKVKSTEEAFQQGLITIKRAAENKALMNMAAPGLVRD